MLKTVCCRISKTIVISLMTFAIQIRAKITREVGRLTCASYHRIVRWHHEIRGAAFVRGRFLVG